MPSVDYWLGLATLPVLFVLGYIFFTVGEKIERLIIVDSYFMQPRYRHKPRLWFTFGRYPQMLLVLPWPLGRKCRVFGRTAPKKARPQWVYRGLVRHRPECEGCEDDGWLGACVELGKPKIYKIIGTEIDTSDELI